MYNAYSYIPLVYIKVKDWLIAVFQAIQLQVNFHEFIERFIFLKRDSSSRKAFLCTLSILYWVEMTFNYIWETGHCGWVKSGYRAVSCERNEWEIDENSRFIVGKAMLLFKNISKQSCLALWGFRFIFGFPNSCNFEKFRSIWLLREEYLVSSIRSWITCRVFCGY